MTATKLNREAKNSVFIDIFKDKRNLLKMYQALHPEDVTTNSKIKMFALMLKSKLSIKMTRKQ